MGSKRVHQTRHHRGLRGQTNHGWSIRSDKRIEPWRIVGEQQKESAQYKRIEVRLKVAWMKAQCRQLHQDALHWTFRQDLGEASKRLDDLENGHKVNRLLWKVVSHRMVLAFAER